LDCPGAAFRFLPAKLFLAPPPPPFRMKNDIFSRRFIRLKYIEQGWKKG
jgi:hypothetical protein